MTQPLPRQVVLASGNAGKLRELSAMLLPLGIALKPQSDWTFPEAVEDAPSFIENALIKARHAADRTGWAAIADDSGLVVPALGGAPGIYSARYSAEPRGDGANNEKLMREMSALSGDERKAYFHCAMVMVANADDPVPLVATGSWWGTILDAPSGAGGFGYDPVFQPLGLKCSSAELEPVVKNRLSHRGQAVQALLAALQQRFGDDS